MHNICFIQGLASDRIQTVVRSRNYQNFDEMAETAVVEESAIVSRLDRYWLEGTSTVKCGNCGKLRHASNQCYRRSKAEVRVNPVALGGPGAANQITCFRCGEKSHVARNCRKPPRRREGSEPPKRPGNESRRTERTRPTVASTQ